MRQLHQFGVEALGSSDVAIDAEVIALAMTCYRALGLKSLKLVLNSLGDKESRESHRAALVAHFSPHIDSICSDCQQLLDENSLRVLDCKRVMDHSAMEDATYTLWHFNE